MKKQKTILSFLTLILALSIVSCDLIVFDKKEETDPDKTIGKTGNYWTGSANGYPEATITIEENNDGNVVANLNYGGTNYEVEGKITTEGIYDYVYSNGDHSKPFTLVKFNADVGDKWEYHVGSQTVVREVVRKSTTDDTPFGFWYVKTIDVEETVPQGIQINGEESQVSKILWKFNHKFGLVSATVTKTDGNTVDISNYTNAGDE